MTGSISRRLLFPGPAAPPPAAPAAAAVAPPPPPPRPPTAALRCKERPLELEPPAGRKQVNRSNEAQY